MRQPSKYVIVFLRVQTCKSVIKVGFEYLGMSLLKQQSKMLLPMHIQHWQQHLWSLLVPTPTSCWCHNIHDLSPYLRVPVKWDNYKPRHNTVLQFVHYYKISLCQIPYEEGPVYFITVHADLSCFIHFHSFVHTCNPNPETRRFLKIALNRFNYGNAKLTPRYLNSSTFKFMFVLWVFCL